MQGFPSSSVHKKHKVVASADDTALASTITVADNQYGVVYRAWVGVDVSSEADLENLPALAAFTITIGSSAFTMALHPFIAHTDTTKFRHVDLGPWFFDFGEDGFYSGVKGDNIVFAVTAMGTAVQSSLNYLYSGD